MKKRLFCILLVIISLKIYSQCPESFHDFSALDIYGNELQMSEFAGKKVLVVNTASYCGYTNQYATLQTLYNTYGGPSNPYDFEIIGFPANNFANQEPYGEDSIIDVCNSYGVTFTMMSKVSVKDPNQHEIYQWLTKQSRNCVQNAAVTWNFQKFMINPDGTWHGTATPQTSPMHSSIVNWITSMAHVEDNSITKPSTIHAFQNSLNNMLEISIHSGRKGDIELNLYDIKGQFLSALYKGYLSESVKLSYPVSNLKSGVYFLKLEGIVNGFTRIVIVK